MREFFYIYTSKMYYYGARYGVYAERSRSNPRISIFVSVDPLAEVTFEPYSYVGNNPILFTDPSGMSKFGIETHFVNEKGETIANGYANKNYSLS